LTYGLLGLIGLIAGGTHGMWAVIPDQLLLGSADHIVHLVMGGVFFCAGCDKSARTASHGQN